MKNYFPYAFLSLFLCSACSSIPQLPSQTSKVVEKASRSLAKFDYTPPTKSASAYLTAAVVAPRFTGDNTEYLVAPFREIATNMGNDIQEILIAKGFTVRGPFSSSDQMVYNDKINSNFIMSIDINLDPQYNRKMSSFAGLRQGLLTILPPSYSITNGEVVFGGNLVLGIYSPINKELLWKKNIALDKVTFTYKGTEKYATQPSLADELKQDNAVYNAFVTELEKYYAKSLDLAWRQIEVAELRSIADQAKKADKK